MLDVAAPVTAALVSSLFGGGIVVWGRFARREDERLAELRQAQQAAEAQRRVDEAANSGVAAMKAIAEERGKDVETLKKQQQELVIQMRAEREICTSQITQLIKDGAVRDSRIGTLERELEAERRKPR